MPNVSRSHNWRAQPVGEGGTGAAVILDGTEGTVDNDSESSLKSALLAQGSRVPSTSINAVSWHMLIASRPRHRGVGRPPRASP